MGFINQLITGGHNLVWFYQISQTKHHEFIRISIRPAKEGTSLATRHAAAVVSWHIWDPGMLDVPKKFSLGGSLRFKIVSALSYIYIIYICVCAI